MLAFEKNTGVTPSEQYLAKLAEKSFLNLWCYPNVYIDKKQNNRGHGKELCDVLIVCGDYILIFSDKTISWPDNVDINLSWQRWYRRAIEDSAAQLNGAARWIKKFPHRVFLDRSCTQSLPITFPSPEKAKIIEIVVALGAGKKCKEYFKGGSGSLAIKPSIKDADHITPDSKAFAPFSIGDIKSDGNFVHVFDDASLDIIMTELDTISDFTNYLEKRGKFIRSGVLEWAHGEEDLLSFYLTQINENKIHDFVIPKDMNINQKLVIDGSHYPKMKNDQLYLAKKRADRISYIWDDLINAFTKNLIEGTNEKFFGDTHTISDLELSVRYMALEGRFERRTYCIAIAEALKLGKDTPRFARTILSGETNRHRDTAYVFLTLQKPDFINYDQYRKARATMLYGYALANLKKHKFLKRVIGIAREPLGVAPLSEDLILVEPEEWTQELEEEANLLMTRLDIMSEENIQESSFHTDEYPEENKK